MQPLNYARFCFMIMLLCATLSHATSSSQSQQQHIPIKPYQHARKALQQPEIARAPIFMVPGPILVNAPLAEQTRPAQSCPDIVEAEVDPATLMPRRWRVAFAWRTINAARNFTCQTDGTLSPDSFNVGYFGPFPGGLYPTFEGDGFTTRENLLELHPRPVGTPDTPENQAGTMWIETSGVNFPELSSPGSLPINRQLVFMIQGPNIPYVAVRTRQNTTGGETPTAPCTTPGEFVIVPFQADYYYWTCA